MEAVTLLTLLYVSSGSTTWATYFPGTTTWRNTVDSLFDYKTKPMSSITPINNGPGFCKSIGRCCDLHGGNRTENCAVRGPRVTNSDDEYCYCDKQCETSNDCCTDYRSYCYREIEECRLGEYMRWSYCSCSDQGIQVRRRQVTRTGTFLYKTRTGCNYQYEIRYCPLDKLCPVLTVSRGNAPATLVNEGEMRSEIQRTQKYFWEYRFIRTERGNCSDLGMDTSKPGCLQCRGEECQRLFSNHTSSTKVIELVTDNNDNECTFVANIPKPKPSKGSCRASLIGGTITLTNIRNERPSIRFFPQILSEELGVQ